MSSRYYMPIGHDVIAKYLCEAISKKKDPECKIEYKGDEFIDRYNRTEHWSNVAIKTAVKVRHNQRDLAIWKIKNKIYHIIEFSCPAGVNVMKKAFILHIVILSSHLCRLLLEHLAPYERACMKISDNTTLTKKSLMILSKQFNKEVL